VKEDTTDNVSAAMQHKPPRSFTIAGQRYALRREDVAAALRTVAPAPIRRHYAVIEGRRHPPKQAICAATGVDPADLATHHAVRILNRLGFATGYVRRVDARTGAGTTD
jgi:hypothetical protein